MRGARRSIRNPRNESIATASHAEGAGIIAALSLYPEYFEKPHKLDLSSIRFR
jgi:hypothetical protein